VPFHCEVCSDRRWGRVVGAVCNFGVPRVRCSVTLGVTNVCEGRCVTVVNCDFFVWVEGADDEDVVVLCEDGVSLGAGSWFINHHGEC
jgi:hypothetical protein